MSIYEAVVVNRLMREGRFLAHSCTWKPELKELPEFRYIGVDFSPDPGGAHSSKDYILAIEVKFAGENAVMRIHFHDSPENSDILDAIINSLERINVSEV